MCYSKRLKSPELIYLMNAGINESTIHRRDVAVSIVVTSTLYEKRGKGWYPNRTRDYTRFTDIRR
jgi:hypothetical protein